MSQRRAEYKLIQENNANQISGQLTALGLDGWKPILLSTVHAVVGPGGQGHIVITVILEHVNV